MGNNSDNQDGTRHQPRVKRGRVSAGTTDPVSCKVQKIIKHDGRPRRKDFDSESKHIVDVACEIYEVLLATENAFPDAVIEEDFVDRAWAIACVQIGIAYDITPDVHKLVSALAMLSRYC